MSAPTKKRIGLFAPFLHLDNFPAFRQPLSLIGGYGTERSHWDRIS